MKCENTKAEITEEGRIIIVVEMVNDSGFKWQKTFDYYTTQEIKLSDLKRRIADEVKRDLKLIDQLKEIKVGEKLDIVI